MKTTIDIPEQSMLGLLDAVGTTSKKEAVNKAIESYIRQSELQKIRSMRGRLDDFMSNQDLEAMRDER